jgi:threonine dehydratase
MVVLDDIRAARLAVHPHIHRTPFLPSRSLSTITGAEVYVKAENLQKTGSFKVRGAFNKLTQIGRGGVVAASMGNHAQAVAFAAAQLGMTALIVMPRTVSILKEEATRGYGAEIELFGETFQESLDHALSLVGRTFVHAFDDELIIAGQGTMGLEIMEDGPELDVLLVPVGGGGLIAGTAIAVKETNPGVQVVGVQAEGALSASRSFEAGHIVTDIPRRTLADGIAVGKVGSATFPIIERYVDDMITVEDDDIAMAVLLFMERNKFVIEGAGAVPLAALMEHRERFRGKRVGLIASGGNIDFTLVDRILYRGLLTSGRIIVFEVIADDIPGVLQALSGLVAAHRGNIVSVVHDRLQADLPIGKTRVIFIVETRTKSHSVEILQDIEDKGYAVRTRG